MPGGKAKRLRSQRLKSIAGIKRKSTVCNIWINLGFANPFTEKIAATAKKIAEYFELVVHPGEDAPDVVIEWARANRPDLLKTARQRRKATGVIVRAPLDEKSAFYASWDWRRLRMEALKHHGKACQCCGAQPGMMTRAGDPVRICVDHIQPISKRWDLRLNFANLQILCDECNMGKGAWDQTDHRGAQSSAAAPSLN